MAVTTTEKDFGYRQALQEIAKVKRQPFVSIGFQGTKGNEIHPGSGDGPKLTIVDVATFNEFGTKNIPERSFIRTTIDENRRSLLRANRRLYWLIAQGKMTTKRALNILGLKITSLIKKKITNLKEPPNAPSTIRQKKSSNPLIDTGTMRSSVNHVVKMRGDSGLSS